MPALFLSGSLGTAAYRGRVYALTAQRLLSLHAQYIGVARKWVKTVSQARDPKTIEVMFDSGAFTAWVRKEPDIQVNDLLRIYKAALKSCVPMFKNVFFINLDKIPGSPGVTATAEEVAEATRISDENYKILTAELGDRVLPVFHQSESVERLHEVAAMNPSYICVSPRNDLGERDRRDWSQRAHLLLKGIPTHGLAATGGEMMLNVPWRSIDSASWIQYAAYGIITVPDGDTFRAMHVSEHSSSKRLWGRHIDTLAEDHKKKVGDICEQLGITLDECRTKLGARELFNVHTLYKVSERSYTKAPTQTTLLEL